MTDRTIFESVSIGPSVKASECGLPWAIGESDIEVQLHEVSQNGRFCYIGAAARTSKQLVDTSSVLTPEQSTRANDRFHRLVRNYLVDRRVAAAAYDGNLNNAVVFIQLNDSIDRTGIALFLAQTQVPGKGITSERPAFLRLAGTRLNDRHTVERMLWRYGYR